MPSTAERVEGYLEGDLVIERALSRGVLNLRRTARWLIEHNGWDATEEAVVSALRRHTPKRVHAAIDDGYELLLGARTGLQTGLGLVAVSRVGSITDRVRDTLAAQGRGEPMAVLLGMDTVTFVVSQAEARDVEAQDGQALEDAVHPVHPVSQVSVGLPKADPASGTALSILLNTFSYRGISLLEISSSAGSYSFFVPGDVTNRAHDVLLHLRGTEVTGG